MIKVSENNIDSQQLEKISKLLKDGAVISYPTDTVYALSCDATSSDAIEKIYKIKNRPKHKPLAIFVRDTEEAKKIGRFPDKIPQEILESFKNGKTTFILSIRDDIRNKNSGNCYNLISPLLYQQNGKIGIRIPNHDFCQKLLKAFDSVLVATSANPSEQPPAISGEQVEGYFSHNYELELLVSEDENGAREKEAIPSRIVDLSEGKMVVLR